jgi:hypothetical protein
MSNFYKLGLSVDRTSTLQLSPYRRGLSEEKIGGFQVWRGIKTPSMIRDEIERIHAEWLATSKDITREVYATGYPGDPENPLARFFADVWTPSYQTWEAFRNTHQSWTSNLWGDTWDEAQTYQRKLESVRKKAREVGYKLKFSDEPVRQPDDSLTAGIKEILWTILKFSIIGGALFLLFLFISKKIGA